MPCLSATVPNDSRISRVPQRSASPAPAANPQPTPGLDADSQAFLEYARGGDARHLERLLREHADRAYTQARHLLGSSADAEDAVQEAYLQRLRQAPRYDGSCPFIAWPGDGS
jgi:hypothetical protein